MDYCHLSRHDLAGDRPVRVHHVDVNLFLKTTMASWIRAWDFLTRGRCVWEVGGSNPGRGTIVGGVFNPSWQLARFSPPNMSYIVN